MPVTNRASAVSYGKTSADDRKADLEAKGCTNIEVIPTKPGTLPTPKS